MTSKSVFGISYDAVVGITATQMKEKETFSYNLHEYFRTLVGNENAIYADMRINPAHVAIYQRMVDTANTVNDTFISTLIISGETFEFNVDKRASGEVRFSATLIRSPDDGIIAMMEQGIVLDPTVTMPSERSFSIGSLLDAFTKASESLELETVVNALHRYNAQR